MAAGTMYELLAVEETAGPEEIKAAYRRAARRWHPDACRSDGDRGAFAERFMRAREAYEVLSDPALREDYDLALRAGVAPESWAAAVGGGVALRRRRGRSGGGGGFGDWEAQLEGLGRRAATERGGEETWGSRVRRARDRDRSQAQPSD
ncbi:Chaperone protein DnaJ [Ananas comosus]|nr:Chaperone protein DnaJ [Ananas comosus]